MTEPAPRRATYEDVLAAPDHLVAELIHGALITSPRPAMPHAHAASVLGMDLGSPFERGRGGPGGWWIIYEPELHLDPDILVPDLAGWRRERMATIPDVAYLELAPDWLCEVLSPATEARDRTDKLGIYHRAGVAWIWLVNPRLQTLEVLARGDSEWSLRATHRGGGEVRVPPFDAIALSLADLWLTKPEGESTPR